MKTMEVLNSQMAPLRIVFWAARQEINFSAQDRNKTRRRNWEKNAIPSLVEREKASDGVNKDLENLRTSPRSFEDKTASREEGQIQ